MGSWAFNPSGLFELRPGSAEGSPNT
jgi:hypothetical protein